MKLFKNKEYQKAVAYQSRKKAKTTNILILTAKQGVPFAIFRPIGGNHNDLFNIDVFLLKY